MSVLDRGIRNAFRNVTRTVSIVLILGLVAGLAFVMLVAHRAVGEKASTALSSVGNTVTIGPPGFSAGGGLGNFLTSAELAPISHLPGVTGINESLNGAASASNLPPGNSKFGGTTQIAGTPGSEVKGKKTVNSSPRSPSSVGAPGSSDSPVKQGTTSLKYPGTMAFATQGLACEPQPCTPPISSYTIYFSGSTEPTAAVNISASALSIVSGHAISGTASADDVMISQEMAQKNGLKVGSTFTAYGATLTVAAIFTSDTQQGNDTVITSLPLLQHLMGDTDGPVFNAVVTASSLTDLAKVTSEIEQALGAKASVVSYLSDAEQAVSDLNGVQSIALDSLVGAVVAAVVILFLVMVMIVRERKREIGIQKAIGTPNGPIMAQFATEALTFTLLGLVVGAVIGVIAASPVTSSLVSHSGASSSTGARGMFGAGSPALTNLTNISAQVGWPVIIECLAGAVIVAVAASAASAWLISRVRPAEVLRSV
jgi:putative ABC transport system permease protein